MVFRRCRLAACNHGAPRRRCSISSCQATLATSPATLEMNIPGAPSCRVGAPGPALASAQGHFTLLISIFSPFVRLYSFLPYLHSTTFIDSEAKILGTRNMRRALLATPKKAHVFKTVKLRCLFFFVLLYDDIFWCPNL